MFIRKKKNRSGSTSVVVIDKSRGFYKEVITIGVSKDEEEIAHYYEQARNWIKSHTGTRDIFQEQAQAEAEENLTKYFLSNVESILLNGTQLILEQVFRLVGFYKIDDEVLKHLVIARISQPLSKAATVEYLKSYFDEDVELHKIYRYLDKLHSTQQEKIQQISVEHTRRILGGNIGVVFYDVTTLYFETDQEDELREKGWSKDGKHGQPQVVLGLLVSRDGYPLAYSLFNGSQYEARTMIPIVEDFIERFNLRDFVVIADSGLINKRNLDLLEAGGYKYIIGARIKNESEEVKQWILSLKKQDGLFHELQQGKVKLVVGYTDKRAKKDRYNREKGVRRLQKSYKSGKITKENINKRGYNKFLELSDNVKVTISQAKIEEDAQWDGLKGYKTNTSLSGQEVYKLYHELWIIEKAYRVTKGNLEMRPMFHFTPKRIEAHVCICFIAYKVYKELERILKISNINLSVDKVLDIAKTVTTLKVKLPSHGTSISKTMLLTKKHRSIAMLFDENFWKQF